MTADEVSGRDLRFDEFLMLGDTETEAVVAVLAPILDAGRQRARKATEVEDFNRTVGLVTANALLGGNQGVHYSRRLETYSGASPYKPDWLGSRRLLGVIDGLAREGLAEVLGGRWAGVFAEGKGIESSFQAAPPLVGELEVLGINLGAVHRDSQAAPVIKLKDEHRRLIRYDAADELVVQRSGELRDYNAFIDGQDISLPGVDAPSFSALARTYNGSWERGGRHFGGWWQPKSKAKRSEILINGERTVELDFGGFFTRALYQLTGQEFRGHDPYDIPEIKRLLEERGIDWEAKGKKAVKRMTNIAISAKSRRAFFSEKSIEKIDLPESLITLCVPIIFNYHDPIRRHLLKGRSLELMNCESDICHKIITNGMNDGVVILPVFDSFITTENCKDYLEQEMKSHYRDKLGCDPDIH